MSVVASKKNESEFKIGHDAVKFAEFHWNLIA